MIPGIVGCLAGPSGDQLAGGDVTLKWWQNTFIQVGGNDEARMGIGFFDAGNNLIGSVTYATYTQPTVWTQRTLNAVAPANAEHLRIYMGMRRNEGTNNDGDIDDIECWLNGIPLAITNPGAETLDTTGWTNTVGGLSVRGGDPDPHTGIRYFSGGTSAITEAYQQLI